MDEAQTLPHPTVVKAANDLKSVLIVASVVDGPLDTAIYHCQGS